MTQARRKVIDDMKQAILEALDSPEAKAKLKTIVVEAFAEHDEKVLGPAFTSILDRLDAHDYALGALASRIRPKVVDPFPRLQKIWTAWRKKHPGSTEAYLEKLEKSVANS